MGYKWEVLAWTNGENGYYNKQVYFGPFLGPAILAAIRAKRNSGCVRIEWRG